MLFILTIFLVNIYKFYDPTASTSNIVKHMKALGYDCTGTDIYNDFQGAKPCNFLTLTGLEKNNFIIANPPLEQMEDFLVQGTSLGNPFAYLVSSRVLSTKYFQNICSDYRFIIMSITEPFKFSNHFKDDNLDIGNCCWIIGNALPKEKFNGVQPHVFIHI